MSASHVSTQRVSSAWWQQLCFSWVTPIIIKALKGHKLSESDLTLPVGFDSATVYSEFDQQWLRTQGQQADKQHTASQKSTQGWLLLRCLFSLYGRRYAVGGLFKLGWSALVICGAFYFVRSLLTYVDTEVTTGPYTAPWTGWVLGTGFFVAAALWGAFYCDTQSLSGLQLAVGVLRPAP